MDGRTVGLFGLWLAIAARVPVGNSGGRDFSHPKSKKLLGVVSVHNCSLRRAIISEADRAHPLTLSLDFSRP